MQYIIYTKVMLLSDLTCMHSDKLGHPPFWIRVGCFSGEDKGLPVATTKMPSLQPHCKPLGMLNPNQLLSSSPFQFLNPESKAPKIIYIN